jgi:hypothetical protein
MTKIKDVAVISMSEVDLAGQMGLNEKQLSLILAKTPAKFIKQRPAKGGGKWDYVPVGYVTKILNLMFGFDWTFEIKQEIIQGNEAIVKGSLSVTIGGKVVTKQQYGNKDIMKRKDNGEPLSLGNDLKAAASDALKKCASMLGVAADVYAPDEFSEIVVESDNKVSTDLIKFVNANLELLAGLADSEFIEQAIEQKDVKALRKLKRAIERANGQA